MSIKTKIKRIKLLLWTYRVFLNFFVLIKFFSKNNKERFTRIYLDNLWNSTESKSGTGSSLKQTKRIRDEIEAVIKNYNIKSLLDLPCGDFNWFRKVNLHGCKYYGGDIVDKIILDNKKKYASTSINFKIMDLINDDLPKVDLIIVRDCLVHFSNKDIFKAIENIRQSKSKYLLVTTFSDLKKNENIVTGSWRPINLFRGPFNLHDPLLIINEGTTEDSGQWKDKSLALFSISKLK
jgi:hypothetical protein